MKAILSKLIKEFFPKKNTDYYILESIKHIGFLMRYYPDHDNSTHVKVAFSSIKVSRTVHLIIWCLYIILSLIFIGFAVYSLTLILNYVIDKQLYIHKIFILKESQEDVKVLMHTAIKPLIYLILGVILLVIFLFRKYDINIYTHLNKRFTSLISEKNIEDLSLEQIEYYLRTGIHSSYKSKVVSKKTEIRPDDYFYVENKSIQNSKEQKVEASSYSYECNVNFEPVSIKCTEIQDKSLNKEINENANILDKEMFKILIKLMDENPDLGAQQFNRIGSYAIKCDVFTVPVECKSQRLKIEYWQRINGGRGASGSLTLIDIPYYSRNKDNYSKAKINLKRLQELFIKYGFVSGADKVRNDIELISKKTLTRERYLS